MKTLLITLLLVCTAFSAYNTTRARNLAYACASTFGTEAEINSWTCKYCSVYKLTNVINNLLRLKLSITQFLIFSDILDIPLKMMPLLLLSEAQSVFKTGLLILTQLK